MLELTNEVKEDIIKQTRDEFPNEACGLLLDINNEQKYYACTNVADDPKEYFRIRSEDNAVAEDIGEVLAVVHSHPIDTCKASDADIYQCNKADIPWVIIGYPNIQFNIIYPTSKPMPLIGRKFSHGVLDCYTLIRDYYDQILNITLPDYPRDNDWWDKGENLYLDNFASAGFTDMGQFAEIQEHDVLLLCIKSKVPNHASIYLGDEKIIHHMQDRLSGETVFGGYWQKNMNTVLRHKRFLDGSN